MKVLRYRLRRGSGGGGRFVGGEGTEKVIQMLEPATLSRDLRELGVVRVPTDAGARYALPETVVGDAIPSLETLLPQLFSRIDGVGEALTWTCT